MKRFSPTEVNTTSPDFVSDNIAEIESLFPEAFTEGRIDFDALKELLGNVVDDREEKYGLNWHGKRRARQLALTPSTGTVRPSPQDSVAWDTTHNLMIEGENLEVLKLLHRSYSRKVKFIYIDPPYNTGKDFIYPDSFQDTIKNYLAVTGQADGSGLKLSSNAETSGRFHTNWLNMMYPRLKLARSLLRDDGVMMISIDDGEINTLKSIATEVFGEENFLAILIWNKQHSQQQGLFKRYHEYVLAYAKNAETLSNISGGEGVIDAGAIKKIAKANPASDFKFPAAVRFDAPDGFELRGTYGDSEKVTVVQGRLICVNGQTAEEVTLRAGWTQKTQMESFFSGKETFDSKGQKVLEFYFSSTGKPKCRKARSKITPSSILPEYGMVSEQTDYLRQLLGAAVFSNPKPVKMMEDFLSWFTSGDDLVLDFFAGSGTLAEAVYQRNAVDDTQRRFILVQLPEPLDPLNVDQKAAIDYLDQIGKPRNIAELTKERLRRAGSKVGKANSGFDGDLGFRVFKLASSNIVTWEPDPENLSETLANSVEHLKKDRTEADICFELLIRLGMELTAPIEEIRVASTTVYSVGDGRLLICLTPEITSTTVESIAEGIGELYQRQGPDGQTTIVFRDSAFADDVAKTNLTAILQQYGLTNVRSL